MPRWFCLILLLAASPFARGDEPEKKPRRIYLDEFRPTPSLKTTHHPLTRSKFPCVNVHFHPARLTPEEIDESVRVMDEANIAVSVSLDGPAGPKFAEHYHMLTDRHPGRFAVFVRMDYIGDGNPEDASTWDVHQPGYGQRMADRLTEAVRQGASGLKLLKELGLTLRDADGRLIPPDDPRFDPIWQRAGELGVPVLWHCGDPAAFFQPINEFNERYEELYRHPEWSFHGGDFPSHQALIDARNRVIERHPQTTFICAHFADLPDDLDQLGRHLDRYPNMMIEFAARISEIGRQPFAARDFFRKYPDRIMFGTDGVPPMTELIPHFQMLETRDEYFPYEDNPFPPQGLWNIYGLDLSDDILRQVYFENAARLIPGVQAALNRYATAHPEAAAHFKRGLRGPTRWLQDMARFDEEDRKGFNPGGVVFVGSSSIRLWKLDESFPGKGYVNRGFGGCEASDVLHFARRIVIPRKPAVIVYYAGDNDIAAGKSPVEAAADVDQFIDLIRRELPKTHFVYIPVKPSNSRWNLIHKQRAMNALVEARCAEDPQLIYLDVATPLLGPDGRPDDRLFLADKLHLNDDGYARWNERLTPVLDRLLAGEQP